MEKMDYEEAAAATGTGGGYYDHPSAQMLRRSPLGEAMVRYPFGMGYVELFLSLNVVTECGSALISPMWSITLLSHQKAHGQIILPCMADT
jgi:hypothetical protein